MRITIGQLRKIIREEVQISEMGSKYVSGRMDIFPQDKVDRYFPHDPNDAESKDFMGPEVHLGDDEIDDDEIGWDGKPTYDRGRAETKHNPTYNPDGSRNKPPRPAYVPMRRR